jgi:hypothetical protein
MGTCGNTGFGRRLVMNETMSRIEALTALRMFVRLQQQIDRAWREGRDNDALALCRLFGSLEVRIFEVSKYRSTLPND